MNLNEYVAEILTVLEKNKKLEQLMMTIAEDSDLVPAKGTIEDIEKRLVEERIIKLTEEYFGKVVAHADGEKLKHKRGFFARRKQNE